MSITIRVATTEDADDVLALWSESDAKPTHTDDRASLRRLMTHDLPALLVGVDTGGRIIGSVIAGGEGWPGSIHRLVVAPSPRGSGRTGEKKK